MAALDRFHCTGVFYIPLLWIHNNPKSIISRDDSGLRIEDSLK